MESKFKSIDEELTWQMFRMSEGNPYIIQELVRERNMERENAKTNTKEERIR